MRSSYQNIIAITALGFVQASAVSAQGYNNNYNGAHTDYGAPPQEVPVTVPAGMTLQASLSTAISTDVAQPGDMIQANLTQPIMLGNAEIPAGSVLIGRVAAAKAGGFMGRAGRLTVKFNELRTPNGADVPMAAHVLGDIGKYKQSGTDSFAGETWKNKVGQTLLRGAVGAGAGAALGTAVGAIAGHGFYAPPSPFGGGFGGPFGMYRPVAYAPLGFGYPYGRSMAAVGAGRGAWSGAAIGGGLGMADGLLLRKGKNVTIASGTPVQLQLDAPISLKHSFQNGTI